MFCKPVPTNIINSPVITDADVLCKPTRVKIVGCQIVISNKKIDVNNNKIKLNDTKPLASIGLLLNMIAISYFKESITTKTEEIVKTLPRKPKSSGK